MNYMWAMRAENRDNLDKLFKTNDLKIKDSSL